MRIWNGVADAPQRATPGTANRRTVIIIARFVPQKDHALLIEAMAGLPGNWRLLLVGDGPLLLASFTGHLVNSFAIDTVQWRHIWFIYALPWAPARLFSSWTTRPLAQPFVNIRLRPAAAGFPPPKGYE